MKTKYTPHEHLLQAYRRANSLIYGMNKSRPDVFKHEERHSSGPFVKEVARKSPLFARVELRNHPVVGSVLVQHSKKPNISTNVLVTTKSPEFHEIVVFNDGAAKEEFIRGGYSWVV
ncbi:MAG: hypothetical protein V1644_03945, partial [Candidatus Micrarchaeota archaeon]